MCSEMFSVRYEDLDDPYGSIPLCYNQEEKGDHSDGDDTGTDAWMPSHHLSQNVSQWKGICFGAHAPPAESGAVGGEEG